MAAIEIKDLEMNAELDKKALENILGGRWIRRTYTRRVVRYYRRRYTRRIRVTSYRYQSYYRTYARTTYQRYTRLVWV
jgi:hypothetical protein